MNILVEEHKDYNEGNEGQIAEEGCEEVDPG